MSSNSCNIDHCGGDHKSGRLGPRAAAWLHAKVRDHVLVMRPRLFAGSVCDDSAAETAHASIVVLYK